MYCDEDHEDLGDDLRITKATRQNAGIGTWVCGTLAGHRFDALVFPAHAETTEYELGQSQISKVWVNRLADKQTVANFDRGWDLRPTTEVAERIVDFLAAGLAEHTFGVMAK